MFYTWQDGTSSVQSAFKMKKYSLFTALEWCFIATYCYLKCWQYPKIGWCRKCQPIQQITLILKPISSPHTNTSVSTGSQPQLVSFQSKLLTLWIRGETASDIEKKNFSEHFSLSISIASHKLDDIVRCRCEGVVRGWFCVYFVQT